MEIPEDEVINKPMKNSYNQSSKLKWGLRLGDAEKKEEAVSMEAQENKHSINLSSESISLKPEALNQLKLKMQEVLGNIQGEEVLEDFLRFQRNQKLIKLNQSVAMQNEFMGREIKLFRKYNEHLHPGHNSIQEQKIQQRSANLKQFFHQQAPLSQKEDNPVESLYNDLSSFVNGMSSQI